MGSGSHASNQKSGDLDLWRGILWGIESMVVVSGIAGAPGECMTLVLLEKMVNGGEYVVMRLGLSAASLINFL